MHLRLDMIAENARTTIGFPFSETSMRLTLSLPCENDRMPHRSGGYVIITEKETSKSSSVCGCAKKSSCGKCQSPKFEVVKYSGYEEDGVTLVVTDRALENTQRLNWCAGAIVEQSLALEINSLLEMMSALCEVIPEREPDSETVQYVYCDKNGIGRYQEPINCCDDLDNVFEGLPVGLLTDASGSFGVKEVRSV